MKGPGILFVLNFPFSFPTLPRCICTGKGDKLNSDEREDNLNGELSIMETQAFEVKCLGNGCRTACASEVSGEGMSIILIWVRAVA